MNKSVRVKVLWDWVLAILTRPLRRWRWSFVVLSVMALLADDAVAALIVFVAGWMSMVVWAWRYNGPSRYLRMLWYPIRWMPFSRSWSPDQLRALYDLGWNLRPMAKRADFSGKLRKVSPISDGFGIEMPVVRHIHSDGRMLMIKLWMPPGLAAKNLVDKPEIVAAALNVADDRIVITVDPENAAIADIRVRFGSDPLDRVFEVEKMPVVQNLGDPLPVAITEEGNVATLQQTHTLCCAATGAGKGSMIWAIVHSLLPAVRVQEVEFWGFDSKASEIKAAESIFRRVAYTPEGHQTELAELRRELDRRGQVSTGREFKPTPAMPLIVAVIDEITSLESIFSDTKQKNAAMADLRVVLSLGRSRGIMVVGAGQEATKEALRLRNLFPQFVAGRLRDDTETRLVLGDGADELGARPHKIPMATISNGYRTAGIAYLRTEQGEIVRVRFPYTSDDDLRRMEQMVSSYRQVVDR